MSIAAGMIYALNFQGTIHLMAVPEEGFNFVSRFELKKRHLTHTSRYPSSAEEYYTSGVAMRFTP